MEHPGERSGSGRGRGRTRPLTIRGGRGTPFAPYGGRGLSNSPEGAFDMSSSPSGYLSSSPSLYTSSSPSTPTDPQQGRQQHTPSPQSHVGEEGSSSDTPIWGTTDPSTGKLWVCPDGDDIVPHNPVGDFISGQLLHNYNQPWAKWGDIPKDNRNAWFNEFLDKHMTLPRDREGLKKAYNHRASRWLSQKLYSLRKSRGKKDWIPQQTADELFDNWATNEKFHNASAQNKENRAKMEGPSYVGGSIPISEHRRKVVESGEVPAGSIEWVTFERTHSRQSEGSERQWINPKAHQVAETFQKLSHERDSQRGTDPTSSSQSDNESLFFEATGGFNKKGRVFGYGLSASRLKQSKRSSSDIEGVSSDELKRMKALVEEQATQMTQDQEMMRKEQEQLRQLMIQEREMMQQQIIQERQMMQQQMTQQAEMMRQMQEQIMSLMKDKGSGSAPGDDDHAGDDDDHNAAV